MMSPIFETLSYDDSPPEILTGGETLTTETKYYTPNTLTLMCLTTESYATISHGTQLQVTKKVTWLDMKDSYGNVVLTLQDLLK